MSGSKNNLVQEKYAGHKTGHDLIRYFFVATQVLRQRKITELKINTVAVRIARKRLKVPAYVDNWTLQEMIWVDPASSIFHRACNEGHKVEYGQFKGRNFELYKEIWKEVFAKRSVASIVD